ncbi:MAG: Chromate resistance protein ChrB, partial [Anaerolineae bacterium]
MDQQEWILFNSQLPASPSSPRVMVWRRMRAAGAVSLQNGVWILPYAPERAAQAAELLAYVKEQGGSGQVFV